jgi:hypothetical protein
MLSVAQTYNEDIRLEDFTATELDKILLPEKILSYNKEVLNFYYSPNII